MSLGNGNPLSLSLLPVVVLSPWLARHILLGDRPRAFLLTCEAQDIQDQIARRLRRRRARRG